MKQTALLAGKARESSGNAAPRRRFLTLLYCTHTWISVSCCSNVWIATGTDDFVLTARFAFFLFSFLQYLHWKWVSCTLQVELLLLCVPQEQKSNYCLWTLDLQMPWILDICHSNKKKKSINKEKKMNSLESLHTETWGWKVLFLNSVVAFPKPELFHHFYTHS